MEQNNNQFMGFDEENSFLENWVNKNVEVVNSFEPIWGYRYFSKPVEIEKEILSIIDEVDFYALYIESSYNNGIWNVFLISHNGADWVQSCWESGQKIVLEKPVLEDDWNEQICNFHFSDDIVVDTGENIAFHAISAFLFITCHDRLKRFAVYLPDFSGIDQKADDRYILQIQRMIENIERDYQRIQSIKKRET